MADQSIPQAWLSARETKNWELLSELTERVAEEQPEEGGRSRRQLLARALWVLARAERAEDGGLPKRLLCGPLVEVFESTDLTDEELLEVCAAAAGRLQQIVIPLEAGLAVKLREIQQGKKALPPPVVDAASLEPATGGGEVTSQSVPKPVAVLRQEPSRVTGQWRIMVLFLVVLAAGAFCWLLMQGASKIAPQVMTWVRSIAGIGDDQNGFLVAAATRNSGELSPAVATTKKILKLSSLDDIYYELSQAKENGSTTVASTGGRGADRGASSSVAVEAKPKPTVHTDGPREPPLPKPPSAEQGSDSPQDDRLFGQRTPQPWQTSTPAKVRPDRQSRDSSGDVELFGERRKFTIEYDTSVRSRPSRMTGLIVAELRAGDTVEADARFGRWLRILSKRGGVAFIEERDVAPAR